MKFWENDTIAAISTPIGESGIGIVRISGQKALRIAQELFRDKKLNKKKIKKFSNYTVHYGFVVDPGSEEKIDEVILVLMKKPYPGRYYRIQLPWWGALSQESSGNGD
jgi:tRNA modification GTPase